MSEPAMSFFAVYRATVTDTVDPQGKGRIQVTIPAVATAVQWAAVCLPTAVGSGAVQLPEVGSAVWVAFEGGDASRPVYLGVLPAGGGTMTQIVRISGTAEALRGLRQVAGLSLVIHSGGTTDTGLRRITAYATDDAVKDVTDRLHLAVEVVVDAQTLDTQLKTLLGQVELAPGEIFPTAVP